MSIGSEDEITGVRLFGFSLKALWFSVVLEAVVLGVVQGLFRWQGNHGVIFAAAQPNVSEGVSHDGILFTG